MHALILRGPYPLTEQSIASAVPEDCVGVYAFGEWTPLGGMWVKRIGRTTRSMRDDLSACVGYYALFQFRCCQSAEEIFVVESELYHRFLPRDNNGHPEAPEGVMAHCPICGYRNS